MGKEVIQASGMSCQHCVMRVTKGLKAMPGVGEVSVDLSTQNVTVEADSDKVSRAQLEETITKTGYPVVK